MFRGSSHSCNNPSSVYDNALTWHKILVMLALTLYLCGAGPAASVQAAPVADETIDSFTISTSDIITPACAHSRYEVQFFARVDRSANLNDSEVDLDGGLGPSTIQVKATSSDTGVADFHPNDRNASALDNLIGRGADFELKTEAPGDTTLTFKSAIQWTGQNVTLPVIQQPIKVVNCRFKISITSVQSGFMPSIAETVVSTVNGEIGGDLKGTLSGDAQVTWNAQQNTPCLQISQTISPSTAKLEGSLSEDGSTLTVQVNYDPAMMFQTNTEVCVTGTSASQQHQFQAPPLTFSVPMTGGSLSKPYTLPLGEMSLSGTAIISVVPIENK